MCLLHCHHRGSLRLYLQDRHLRSRLGPIIEHLHRRQPGIQLQPEKPEPEPRDSDLSFSPEILIGVPETPSGSHLCGVQPESPLAESDAVLLLCRRSESECVEAIFFEVQETYHEVHGRGVGSKGTWPTPVAIGPFEPK